MSWIRVIIVLLFVAGGLWVFTPGSYQPVEVRQMQIGFLKSGELEWLPVITDDTDERKQQVNAVIDLIESAAPSPKIACFSEGPDIEMIILNVNKNQYLVDGSIYLTETGGIYEDRQGKEQKQLSKSEIEYLTELYQNKE